MSKNNGNGLPPKNGSSKKINRYHIKNPDTIPNQDGISIVAAGDEENPTEVHLYCKVPGAEYASRFVFREPELLGDFIEQLIAYRRLVFPDARKIDTNAKIEE